MPYQRGSATRETVGVDPKLPIAAVVAIVFYLLKLVFDIDVDKDLWAAIALALGLGAGAAGPAARTRTVGPEA
jgi:hypothetical protein